MAIKKLCRLFLMSMSLFMPLHSYADNELGQVIQINTHFKSIIGKPTWLLIVRDVESGQILPYMYEVKNNDNYWIAFTVGRSYRIVASNLTFGPYAKIHNFCNMENGILDGKSMWVTLTGDLSPNPKSFRCHVTKYPDTSFTIVNPGT